MSNRTGFDIENYNRVFVLGAKDCSMDELRDAFSPYGNVKDVYIVHKNTKGIAYVTFSKASEAALAIEEMNGKTLSGRDRSLKVILANSRSEGSVREAMEDEKMRRLFIMVPKTMTEDEIHKEFQEYGRIEYVRLVKDRGSGQSRGLAYVKFSRAVEAAVALETCPQPSRPASHEGGARSDHGRSDHGSGEGYGGGRGERRHSGGRDRDSYPSLSALPSLASSFTSLASGVLPSSSMTSIKFRGLHSRSTDLVSDTVLNALDQIYTGSVKTLSHTGETMLEVTIPSVTLKDYVTKLFELIPGMEYVSFERSIGSLLIRYSMPQLASYAKDRLDRFEVTPGSYISVQMSREHLRDGLGGFVSGGRMGGGGMSGSTPDMNALYHTIQNMGMFSGGIGGPDLDDGGYCSVPLPRRQPLAEEGSEAAERLFIVSSPELIPDHVLKDLFCRFGSFISANYMPGKKCGYVRYASKDSAMRAIETLHLQTVLGNRLKVMLAEPPRSGGGGGGREKRNWSGDDDGEGFKYTRFD